MAKLTDQILKNAGIGTRQRERILYAQKTGATWERAIMELGPKAKARVKELMKPPLSHRPFSRGVSGVFKGTKKVAEIHQIRGQWREGFSQILGTGKPKHGVIGYEVRTPAGRKLETFGAVATGWTFARTPDAHKEELASALKQARAYVDDRYR